MTYQVVSPYEYGDQIDDERDEEFDEEGEQILTTVPKTTANKTVHRFQDTNFLVGLLDVVDEVVETATKSVFISESNQEASINLVSISTAQPLPAKATDTSVPSSSTQQKSSTLLIIKPTTTNSLKAIKLKKNGEARKPYTFKKKSATSSSSNTISSLSSSSNTISSSSSSSTPISPPSHTIDNLFKMQNSKLTNSNFKSDQIAIKQEKLDTENWLTASQIDEFVIF